MYEPGYETDFEIHEGRYFSLCGGGGRERCFWRIFLVGDGGGMLRSGFLVGGS